MLKKIISGGQAGVEIAALDTAIRLNIAHEGWAFQRKMTEDRFWSEKYNVKTILRPSYHDRLEKNIIDSDGIVILTYGQLAIGSKIIKYLSAKNKKPCLYIDLTQCSINHAISSIRKWVTNHEIEAIYFTGSKPVGESKIYEETVRIIEGICSVEMEQENLSGFVINKDEDTSS